MLKRTGMLTRSPSLPLSFLPVLLLHLRCRRSSSMPSSPSCSSVRFSSRPLLGVVIFCKNSSHTGHITLALAHSARPTTTYAWIYAYWQLLDAKKIFVLFYPIKSWFPIPSESKPCTPAARLGHEAYRNPRTGLKCQLLRALLLKCPTHSLPE